MDGLGGRLAAEVLRAHGVDTVFTLSGGHLFPLYDGCVQTDIRLVDTRHEQTATFAAEGWAKVTRRPGVAALTAGPGVTNGVSALTSAHLDGLADARRRRPGAGGAAGAPGRCRSSTTCRSSRSVTKRAATAAGADAIGAELDAALRGRRGRRTGARRSSTSRSTRSGRRPTRPMPAAPDGIGARGRRARSRTRSRVGRGADRRRRAPGAHGRRRRLLGRRARKRSAPSPRPRALPVFANGLGRGLAARRPRARVLARPVASRSAAPTSWSSRARRSTSGSASVAFGDARVVHLADAPDGVAQPTSNSPRRPRATSPARSAALAEALGALRRSDRPCVGRRGCAAEEQARRAGEVDGLASDADADQADPHLRRAPAPPRPRRDRHRRRRRLRLVRGQVRRQLRPRRVPRPGPVRLSRHRLAATRSRPRSRTPTARSC